MRPEEDVDEILVPVSIKAPNSLPRAWSPISVFQMIAQTLAAEQKTAFELFLKMSIYRVVSFLLPRADY